jgi:arylsulfatase A-like enzyme
MGQKIGVVVLDTLRLDTFRAGMESLLERPCREFRQMYSTARWTSPAHASLFTGLYPSEAGVYAGEPYLTTTEPVLAERLQDAGYHTVALSENINVDPLFEFDRGFDQFHRSPGLRDRPIRQDGEFDWRALEKRIADRGIRRPIEAVVEIVRSDTPTVQTLRTAFEMYRASNDADATIDWAGEPLEQATVTADDLFLFANIMTPHYPYDPPDGYRRREPLYTSPMELTLREEPVTEREHARHYENYAGAVDYLDDVLPSLLGDVDWDLLFVLSDHGELFGEHGLRGHQYGMYEELVHVPAVASGNLVEPGTTDRPTSLIDVYRTVLAAAGVTVDDGRGIDLLGQAPPSDRLVYAESAGCEWYGEDASGIEDRVPPEWDSPHYMVRSKDATLLADKDGTRAIDPETGAHRPDRESELREAAQRLRKELPDCGPKKDREEVPEHVQTRLEELGYRG